MPNENNKIFRKNKNLWQIFTPKNIVNHILDSVNYTEWNILEKHIIDNSCWSWAFLCEIIIRYIEEYKRENNDLNGIEYHLSNFIHGIELDPEAYNDCLKNLNDICTSYDIDQVKRDIINWNSLHIKDYNWKMDFVVWNPPYVRVHNLNEWYEDVKQYSFSQWWMTDLYIVFFEIWLNMLKSNWYMWYISPNSFYTSIAWTVLRDYIRHTMSLYKLMDLWHYQPFEWATTYTTISCFKKDEKFNTIQYHSFSKDTGNPNFITNIDYDKLFIEWKIILSNPEKNNKFFEIYNADLRNSKIYVKNWFATLADKIFIQKSFPFSEYIIDIIKGSTWEWKKAIFPYKNWVLIKFEEITDELLKNYLLENKDDLEKRSLDKKTSWYGYWRSQAINDVDKYKISINTTIKDKNSIKIHELQPWTWIYSGLYIISKYPIETIKDVIISDDFVSYIQILNKCKSWWYYTFSSKDLHKFLSYKLEKNEQQWLFGNIK